MKTLCPPAVLHRGFWSWGLLPDVQNLPKKGCESQQSVMALQDWHSAEGLQLSVSTQGKLLCCHEEAGASQESSVPWLSQGC